MFYLKSLKLKNFRCYLKKEFSFSPQRNIIIGKNAAGKTSIVEAIHCLGVAKSFKQIKDIDLIKKGESFYNIKGNFINDEHYVDIMVSYDSSDKRIQKDAYIYRNISEYLGFINVVFFSPDDLDLIKGSPAVRRRFLDQNIGQINKEYLQSLIKYKKILKERNEFLKSFDYKNYNKDLFTVLTQALINEASVIIKAREDFINKLNPYLNEIVRELSLGQEKSQMVYNFNCNVDNLWKKADERTSYDFLLKTTTWGPTRDDIDFLVNGDLASIYCSQGQIRTVTLAAKLALAKYFLSKNNQIIVILDDVLSEFDNNRQEQVLKLIDKEIQTFITTTSIDNIDEEIVKSSNILEIRKGE